MRLTVCLVSVLLCLVPMLCPVAASAGQGSSEQDKKLNILLILADTLRRDHLGCYGYEKETSPNIDRLAKQGALFERAYSHSPWTMPSVASLFTSLEPRVHGVRDWLQPLETRWVTLAEILQAAGYRTEAYVSHVVFTPEYNFDQGFQVFNADVLNKGDAHEITSSREVADFGIESLRAGIRQPFFMWLHFFDPHGEYVQHEEFSFGDTRLDRYDSEIAFTDHHIGRVLRVLDELELTDRTIVVFIADHGEEFCDHLGVGHSSTLYDELIRIPLIIKVPGLEPHTVEPVIPTIDLAPTLLNLVGLPVPRDFQGRTLPVMGDRLAPHGDRLVFAETYRFADKRAVISWPFKLILDRQKGDLELYHLLTDSDESLAVKDYDRMLQSLEGLLYLRYGKQKSGAPIREISDETRERLRSLGYLP